MTQETTVSVRFYAPPDDLASYFSTFYVAEVTTPKDQPVTDALQPEWSTLRLFDGATPRCWIEPGEVFTGKPFMVTGPSSRSAQFALGTTRCWGVSLPPLGWARYVGLPAVQHANLLADGHTHPSFEAFRPLAETLFDPQPDEAAELERIIAFFRELPPHSTSDEERILAIHAALVDPLISNVGELVEAVGCNQRTIERVCDRAFGFAPKLLLRRQRFMRSLAQFMLDPTQRWTGVIDAQYHDQAQFVRNFREFMGVSPSEYAATPHPMLEPFIRERSRVSGSPVQTMDAPRVLEPFATAR